MQKTPETWVQSLGWEDPLEEEMATHFSILAWRIPWTEEPGGLHEVTKSWLFALGGPSIEVSASASGDQAAFTELPCSLSYLESSAGSISLGHTAQRT